MAERNTGMIVFYGTFRQMVDYARRHDKNPRTDMILAKNGFRGIAGRLGPFDVIMCQDYTPSREEYDLLEQIMISNQLSKEHV